MLDIVSTCLSLYREESILFLLDLHVNPQNVDSSLYRDKNVDTISNIPKAWLKCKEGKHILFYSILYANYNVDWFVNLFDAQDIQNG